MKRLAVILVVAVAALGAAGQAAAVPRPDSMVVHLMADDFAGQWGKAWDLLHPGQQRYVPRAKFIQCQVAAAGLAGYKLVSAKILATGSEPLHVAGVPQHTGVAVNVHLSVKTGMGNVNGFDQVVHAVWTGSRWAWIVEPNDVAAYRAGHCP